MSETYTWNAGYYGGGAESSAITALSYGSRAFTKRGDDLGKAHAEDLTVLGTTPEEPLTLDLWSNRSESGIIRSGIEVVKIAQLVNTVNGTKTPIRGRARFELTLDGRLTYAQRLLIATACYGVLSSVGQTATPGEGKHYRAGDTVLFRLIDGLFLPHVGEAVNNS